MGTCKGTHGDTTRFLRLRRREIWPAAEVRRRVVPVRDVGPPCSGVSVEVSAGEREEPLLGVGRRGVDTGCEEAPGTPER